MNCLCNPPQLAVLKTCNNEKNPGRQYFSCPNPQQSAKCKLFTWVGASMPMSLAFGRSRFPSKSKKTEANKSTSPQKVNGRFEAKLLVHEFIEGPPVEIWLSIQCPTTPVVNDLFSRLPPGKSKFNNGLKMWVFNFDQYERIKYEFTTPPFDAIYLPDLVKFLAKGLANFQKKFNKLNVGADPPLNLTPLIRSKILPFQLETVKFVVRRGGRALLGDEMGCGKTLQAISIMMHYRQHWPVLIVVPSSLMKQWPDEILNYAGDVVRPTDIRTIGQSSKMSTGLITIITYKVMDNLVGNKLLSPEQFGVVIADESHNLKNKDSQRSQAIIPFLQKATVAICMTGTPAVNRPVELYSQLNGILPDVFSEYKEFVYRYCDAKAKGNLPGLNVSGSSNEQELNLLLTSLVMVRRTKDQVLKELPEKQREIRNVDPDPEYLPQLRAIQAQSKRLEEQLKNNPQMDPSDFQKLTNEKQQLLTQMYGVTGYSKIRAIKDELVKLIEESRAERGVAMSKKEVGKTKAAPSADFASDNSDSDVDFSEHNHGSRKKAPDQDSVMFDVTQVMTLDSPSQQATQKLDLFAPPQPLTKRKNGQTITSTTGTARAPILLEIEDDLMNCDDNFAPASRAVKAEVQDLCDSDSSSVHSSNGPSHKRLKKSLTNKTKGSVLTTTAIGMAIGMGGTADSSSSSDDEDGFLTANEATADEGGCYWEDNSSDCDFNISDIKNGKASKNNNHRPTSTTATTSIASKSNNNTNNTNNDKKEEETRPVFSLFDQRTKNQTKRKKSTTATAASKKSANNGTSKTGRKKKGAARESDEEPENESEEKDEEEVSDYDPSKRPTSQLDRIGQKIIVFFHHKNVLSAIEDSLLKMRVKYVKIDGSTSQKNRGALVEQFQNDNVTEVALLSITACGVGLNLTRANVALFGELNWSLGAVLQAEDRIHRLGQVAKVVRIIYMIARGTLDENIWDQLQNKHQVVGATVGTSGKPSYGGGMSINSSSSNNISPTTGDPTSNAPKPAADMRSYLASAAQAQPSLPLPPPMAVPVQSTGSGYNNTASGNGGYNNGSTGAYNATVSIMNPSTSSTSSHANLNNYQNNSNAYSNATSSMSTIHHTSGYGAAALTSNPTSNTTSISNNYSNMHTSSTGHVPPQRSASMNNPCNTSSLSSTGYGYGNVNPTNSSHSGNHSNIAGTNNFSHNLSTVTNMGPSVNQSAISSYNINPQNTSSVVPSRGYSYPPTNNATSSTVYPNYNNAINNSAIISNDNKANSYGTHSSAYATSKPVMIAPAAPTVTAATAFVVNINGPQEEFAYSASTQASHSSEATSGESKGSDPNQSSSYYNSNTAGMNRNTYATTKEGSNVTITAANVTQRAAMPVSNGYNSAVNNVSAYGKNGPFSYQAVPAQPIAPLVTPVAIAPLNVPASTFSTVHPGINPPVSSSVPYNTTTISTTNISTTYVRGTNVPTVPIAPIPTSYNITPSGNISAVPATSVNTSIAPMNITTNTSNSAGKAPLPPEVLARIEANKLAAQARLAAARLQKSATAPGTSYPSSLAPTSVNGVGTSAPSLQNSSSLNNTATAVPAAMAMSPASKMYPPNSTSTNVASFSAGSPVALHAAIQSRQATANVPPGVVKGANAVASRIATSNYNNNISSTTSAISNSSSAEHGYGTSTSAGVALQLPQHNMSAPAAHVFSTGRGTSIPVSDAKMQQAAALLDSAILPAGPSRPAQGHVPPHAVNSGGQSVYGNNYSGQYLSTASTCASSAVAPPPAVLASCDSTSSNSNSGAVASSHAMVSNPPTSTFTSGTLYFDGTAQSNLQRGGAGYQLFASNGRTIRENGVRMSGTCSSNQAEYVGLIQGLTAALHCGVQDLQVFGDSEVVIKQMLGLYPVRNPALQGLFTRAKALQGRFRRIQLQWVPKEKNTGADALCQRALLQPETVAENCDWFVSSVVS